MKELCRFRASALRGRGFLLGDVDGKLNPRARLVYVAVVGHSLGGLPCRTERAGLMYLRLLAENDLRRVELLSAFGRVDSRTRFAGGVTDLRA